MFVFSVARQNMFVSAFERGPGPKLLICLKEMNEKGPVPEVPGNLVGSLTEGGNQRELGHYGVQGGAAFVRLDSHHTRPPDIMTLCLAFASPHAPASVCRGREGHFDYLHPSLLLFSFSFTSIVSRYMCLSCSFSSISYFSFPSVGTSTGTITMQLL